MNGRERLTALVEGRPTERLSWTLLLSGSTRVDGAPPGEGPWMQGASGECGAMDFCRHLGCDIFQLGFVGTHLDLRSPGLRWPTHVTCTQVDDNGDVVTEWRSPWGTLKSVAREGRTLKRAVDSLEAIRIWRRIWEGVHWAELDPLPVFSELDRLVGADGIVVDFPPPSTVPKLLQTDMGTENFYYMLVDHPEEMAGLIATIHQRDIEAWEIHTRNPCSISVLCENTSTHFISPDVYRKFNGPHVRDFVDIMHDAGRRAVIHMCGHVRGILPDIKRTGLDGVHALTPPLTGDTPWELALDVLGEETFIVGLLDPSVWCVGPVKSIGPALDALYTPRLRRARFVLCLAADGLDVPYERFAAVKTWMERNGETS